MDSELDWRTVLVLLALAGVAWWIWKHQGDSVPPVQLQNNATPPPATPQGIPQTLTQKMANAVDTQIPVVMTSGSAVQYDEDEVAQIVRAVLAKINAQDEQLTLIQVASTAKTIDSYKTVSYEMRASVYDAKENISLLIDIGVLIPVSGTMYIRKLRLTQDAAETVRGPAAYEASGGLAEYEDPVAVLRNVKLA